MGSKMTACFGAALILLSTGWIDAQKTSLPAKDRSWLEDEVGTIATPREREVFQKLETDEDRRRFVEEFWRQRDPTPATPANEIREEHARRIAAADKAFGRGSRVRGSKSERGRVYVILGLPLNVEKFERKDIYPCEVWSYPAKPLLGQTASFRLLFFKRGGGPFVLYDPGQDTPRALLKKDRNEGSTQKEPEGLPASWSSADKQAWLLLRDAVSPELAAATIPAASALLRDIERYPQKTVRDDYALDILARRPPAETSYSANAIGNKSAVGVFQDPTGVFLAHCVLVPESVTVEAVEARYFAVFRTTFLLADSRGRTLFEGAKSMTIDWQKDELEAVAKNSLELYDALPVIPGTHTLHLLFENTVSKEFTAVERTITVPAAGGFGMSPTLLARKAFTAAPAPGGPSRAFQVGAFQLYPAVRNEFPEKARALLFFQLFGLPRTILEGGRVEVTVSREGKAAQTVGRPVRDFEGGRNFLIELPTGELTVGSYVLRACLRDPNGQEVIAVDTPLQMTTGGAPGAVVVAQTNPPAYDPYYAYVLGTQYLNAGDLESAVKYLDKAHANEAKNLDYGVGYARCLLLQKESAKAREVLLRYVDPEGGSFALYETLGRAAQDGGDIKEAVTWYERALTFGGNFADVEAIKKKLAELKK